MNVLIIVIVIVFVIVMATLLGTFAWITLAHNQQATSSSQPIQSSNAQTTVPTTVPSTSQYTRSDMFGGTGGQPFFMTCPQGTSITKIDGRGGYWVDKLSFQCGNTTPIQVGGAGGAAIVGAECGKGYNGVNVTYGQYLGKVEPICGSATGVAIGAGRGKGSGTASTFVCPQDTKLIGVSGKSGIYVDSIQFTCAPPTRIPNTTNTTTTIPVQQSPILNMTEQQAQNLQKTANLATQQPIVIPTELKFM